MDAVCFQIHRDKLQFPIVKIRDKRRQCLICVSGFSSDTILIECIGTIIEHLMILLEHTLFIDKIGRWNPIFICVRDLPEFLILKCRRCNERHIPCRNIVILIVKPVRICKMRIGASKLLCLLIHHADKIIISISNGVRNRICNLIGRRQQHSI